MVDTEQFDGHTLNDSLKMGEPDHDDAREMLCGGGLVGWLIMSDHPGAEANAQLIAAAPDLLAEVKRLRAENEELRAAFGQRLRDLVGDFLKNEDRKRYR